MRILVTGANGFLGANLVRELMKTGQTVKAFVRASSSLKGLGSVPCEIFRGDISSYDDVHKALLDCDAMIHAASTTSLRAVPFEFYKKVNVDATEIAVRAVLSQGNKRFVYVSTANAFAPGSKTRPGDETVPFPFRGLNSGYINSKCMAQQLVLDLVEKDNLNAVVVNPTFMIGPYDTKPSSGKIILMGLNRGIQWYPPGGKNFVHVKDVAKGICQALVLGEKGHCYLLAGKNMSYKHFFSLLNRVAHRKRVLIRVPKMLIHFAGTIADTWSKLTDHDAAFNKTNAKLLCLDNYYTGAKANHKFGLAPTPIVDAIKEALGWFKKENYVSEDNYSTHGTNLDL